MINPTMYVFIDTNILLSFYHYASDDLDQLQTLVDSIKQGAIVLCLSEQVRHEFWRNREAKIADALSRLREQKLNLQFPQICKDSTYYPALRNAQKEYERNHGLLVAELIKAANSRELKADTVIDELFNVATIHPMETILVGYAQLRMSLGNPPGKNGSLGDAVNWETLLEKVPDGEDLYFVSDDKDFRSPIDESRFNSFLTREWNERKFSNLLYYNRLSQFFAEYYPNIKLVTEKEIERHIGDLARSASFLSTHEVVGKLGRYTDFTDDQVDQIANAVLTNNQVYWIIHDTDVKEFVRRVIKGKESALDKEKLDRLLEMLQEDEKTEPATLEVDLPF